MINFDSTDWDSIKDTIKKINEIGRMQVGKTEESETILFSVVSSGDLNDVLKTETFQDNGWIRKNYYDPSTHSVEEMYCKID